MSDAAIRTACPECHAAMRVSVRAVRRRVRCPRCQVVFTVPEADAPLPAFQNDDPLAGLDGGAAVDDPAKRSPPHIDATVDPDSLDAPELRSPAAWRSRVKGFLSGYADGSHAARFRFVALVLGLTFMFLGYYEFRLRGRSRAEPQTITCEQLATRGPGENLHIVLTEFVLLSDYVYETGLSGWKGAWVPAIARQNADRTPARQADGATLEPILTPNRGGSAVGPAGSDIRVIVSFPKADGPEYIRRAAESGAIQGTIMGPFPRIGDDRQRLLRERYPRVDLDNCQFLVAGRRPFSAATAYSYVFGGLGLSLLSLGSAALRARRT